MADFNTDPLVTLVLSGTLLDSLTSDVYVWGPAPIPPVVVDPWSYDLGVSQGRIQPVNWTAEEGSYVFVLGSDLDPSPDFRLDFLDGVQIEQEIVLTDVDLIGATFRLRQPEDIPQQRNLQGSPEDIVLTSNAVVNGIATGANGIIVPNGSLTTADAGQEVEIGDALNPVNDGLVTIDGVMSQTVDGPLDIAIVDKTFTPEGPTAGMTVLRLGARFRARILVDDVMRSEAVEFVDSMHDRIDMKAHVSKISGSRTVRFELDLIDERNIS